MSGGSGPESRVVDMVDIAAMERLVVELDAETIWMERGACRDVAANVFFPDPVGGPTDPYQAAKRICAVCTVRAECLGYAREHGIQVGCWGGRSPRQRGVSAW